MTVSVCVRGDARSGEDYRLSQLHIATALPACERRMRAYHSCDVRISLVLQATCYTSKCLKESMATQHHTRPYAFDVSQLELKKGKLWRGAYLAGIGEPMRFAQRSGCF